MANTPEKQEIVPEDFKKDEQELASKIADPVNTYIEQLNGILDNGLTIGENLRAELKTVQVTGGSPLTYSYGRDSKPVGLWVINYANVDNPAEVLPAAVQAKWSYDGKGNITLESVTALTADQKYTLTIIAISG